MKRHYFISDQLADIEKGEHLMLEEGIPQQQIHVLSNNKAEVEIHDLHPVADVMKTDVIRQGLWGLLIGTLGAIAVLLLASLMGLTERIGMVPFGFLAVVILGFCTWEGGFLGFQQQNNRFRRFQKDLQANKHILFVDADRYDESALRRVLEHCPGLAPAGTGKAMPTWIVNSQRYFDRFIHWAP